jgi:hypothetical protein
MTSFSTLQSLSFWEFVRVSFYITIRARWWSMLVLIVVIVLANSIATTPVTSSADFLLILIPTIIIIFLGYPLVILISTSIRYFSMRKRLQNMLYEFDAAGMKISNSNGELSKPWRTIRRWKETRNYFLIYQSRQSAFPLLKKEFGTDEQIAEFREFLTQHCPSKR